jgi:hypothetical protein
MKLLYFIVIFLALATHTDSFTLTGYKLRQFTELEAKKTGGKPQLSDGMKLGKGFGSAEVAKVSEGSAVNIPNPMVYSEANNPNPSIREDTSASSQGSTQKPANAVVDELPNTDAVFKKYGIGDGKSDRFGNQVTQSASSSGKSSLKPGEERPFGAGK